MTPLRKVKLKAKTHDGVRRLAAVGHPATWEVFEKKDEISFSERPGPWLRLIPKGDTNTSRALWVHETADRCFEVTPA